MLGDAGQRRQQRQRFEAVKKVRDRFLIDEQAIGDKKEIQFASLGFTGDTAGVIKTDAGIRLRRRMTPGGHVARCAVQNGAEAQLSCSHNRLSLLMAQPAGDSLIAVQRCQKWKEIS